MSTQVITDLNPAQSAIYTRSNIGRANPGFDDTDVAGIGLTDDHCIVIRKDGTEEQYSKKPIKDAYVAFNYRLKDFFSYLGPNYRGPSIWHDNYYVLFKGWHYSHSLGHLSHSARLQAQWADRFIHLTDVNKLKALLHSDQTDLGYVVAPDGIRIPDRLADMESDLEDPSASVPAINPEPYCSCGSFQRQLLNVSDFQAEIEHFKPSCIHLTWFNKYRQFLCKRTEVRESFRNCVPDKCVAWWYAPPNGNTNEGRFVLLYTKYGAQAPATHWRPYKSQEVFTQRDAWTLFDNMMDAGFVPFPGSALPQLSSLIKKQH